MVRLFGFVRRFNFFKNKKWSCHAVRRTIRDIYHFEKKCDNQGSHGRVYEGENLESHEPVAIKFISRKVFNMFEVECLKNFSHNNIVHYIESFQTKEGTYIITEKCKGDLFDLTLEKGGRFLNEIEVSYIIRQVLYGIEYIHQKNVAHCDLKLSNIMYNLSSHSKYPIIKIIDFGNAQSIRENEFLENMVGSVSFIAPEIIAGSYTKACDLWSLGCIVFCMLFGYNPFNPNTKRTREQVFQAILKGFDPKVQKGYGAFFPEHIQISSSAKNFISNLLTLDWRNRMTAQEALKHPWILKSSNRQ